MLGPLAPGEACACAGCDGPEATDLAGAVTGRAGARDWERKGVAPISIVGRDCCP